MSDSHIQSRISLGRYEYRKSARNKPILPLIEEIGMAKRVTWDDELILTQIEIEDGHNIEWYARNHRTLESEAGVGFQSLDQFKRWLNLHKQKLQIPDFVADILYPPRLGFRATVREICSSPEEFLARLPFKFALEHYKPKF